MRGSRAAATTPSPCGWTRKDNACDASLPPVNGDVGNCTDTLVSGTSCVPTCDAGYVLKGVTSCTDRVLTEVAMCGGTFTDGAELKATVDACVWMRCRRGTSAAPGTGCAGTPTGDEALRAPLDAWTCLIGTCRR